MLTSQPQHKWLEYLEMFAALSEHGASQVLSFLMSIVFVKFSSSQASPPTRSKLITIRPLGECSVLGAVHVVHKSVENSRYLGVLRAKICVVTFIDAEKGKRHSSSKAVMAGRRRFKKSDCTRRTASIRCHHPFCI